MTLNLIGYKNYELTVVEKLVEKDKAGRTQWLARCSCGRSKVFTTDAMRNAKTCHNCQWHVDHKDSYISWESMIQRCDNPKSKNYSTYGGRGITHQLSWGLFVRFFEDMGDPPKDIHTGERLTLERKDNNGNYTKDNCIWATRSEQQRNKGDKYKFI